MGIFRRRRRNQSTTREVVADVGTDVAVEYAATGLFHVLRGIVSGIVHILT
ncbi:hypothetical protein ACQPW1_36555 [Nocardia sp. CA-128927]|uniref:hypothetical protein n=1 Tax=Nocardia sp. CA-128927 TaxID=3239975 RepID=UPI003D99F908